MSEYEFDVALSFAGEDRAYVQRVANSLRTNGIKVFYDEFEVATLWGQDLFTTLDEIYRKKSRFAIVFASNNYARKMWTSHERQSAQARNLESKGAYLLPVRLDATEVPGLRPTTAYLDGSVRSPEEIASIFLQKIDPEGLASEDEAGGSVRMLGVPLTEEERRELVAVRPPCWEYLLMAGGIWQGVYAPEQKNLDHDIRYAPQIRRRVEDGDISDFVSEATDHIGSILHRLESVISLENQERAVGKPGAPGNPVLINHMCQRFGNSYEEILDWGASIRGVSCSEEYRNLLELLARFSEPAVAQIRTFADELVTQASRIPAHIASESSESLEITLPLTLTLDEEVSRQFHQEVRRVYGVEG